jgi:hypothetical protein
MRVLGFGYKILFRTSKPVESIVSGSWSAIADLPHCSVHAKIWGETEKSLLYSAMNIIHEHHHIL